MEDSDCYDRPARSRVGPGFYPGACHVKVQSPPLGHRITASHTSVRERENLSSVASLFDHLQPVDGELPLVVRVVPRSLLRRATVPVRWGDFASWHFWSKDKPQLINMCGYLWRRRRRQLHFEWRGYLFMLVPNKIRP